MAGIRSKIASYLVKTIQKTLGVDFLLIQGIVDGYKNGEHVVHSEKLITNNGLRHIPLCFIWWGRGSSPPASGSVFGMTPIVPTYNLLHTHKIGTGTAQETIDDTDLQSPIATRTTDQYMYYFDATNRKASITAIANFSFTEDRTITEYGIFFYKDYSGGSNLFDRTTFQPINVSSGDVLTFKYTLQVSV